MDDVLGEFKILPTQTLICLGVLINDVLLKNSGLISGARSMRAGPRCLPATAPSALSEMARSVCSVNRFWVKRKFSVIQILHTHNWRQTKSLFLKVLGDGWWIATTIITLYSWKPGALIVAQTTKIKVFVNRGNSRSAETFSGPRKPHAATWPLVGWQVESGGGYGCRTQIFQTGLGGSCFTEGISHVSSGQSSGIYVLLRCFQVLPWQLS